MWFILDEIRFQTQKLIEYRGARLKVFAWLTKKKCDLNK